MSKYIRIEKAGNKGTAISESEVEKLIKNGQLSGIKFGSPKHSGAFDKLVTYYEIGAGSINNAVNESPLYPLIAIAPDGYLWDSEGKLIPDGQWQ